MQRRTGEHGPDGSSCGAQGTAEGFEPPTHDEAAAAMRDDTDLASRSAHDASELESVHDRADG